MSYQLFIWVTIELWGPKLTAIFSNKSMYFRAEVGLTSVWRRGTVVYFEYSFDSIVTVYKTFNLLTTWPTIRVVLTVLNSPLINWVIISMPLKPNRGSDVGSNGHEIQYIIQLIINLKRSFVYTSSLRAVKFTSNVTAYKQIITIIWETHTSNALQVVHQFHA